MLLACLRYCSYARLYSPFLRIYQWLSKLSNTATAGSGGLISEKESFAVAYVKGFYLADVWKELMANLISAYIGAGITRKAFSIGKLARSLKSLNLSRNALMSLKEPCMAMDIKD